MKGNVICPGIRRPKWNTDFYHWIQTPSDDIPKPLAYLEDAEPFGTVCEAIGADAKKW